MKITATELIKIAEAEIGYKEKKSNSQLDDKNANAGDGNYTKYGRDLYAAGMFNGNKNGYEWCAQFVTWCALQLCGEKKLAEKLLCQAGTLGAGCKYAMEYYKAAGRFDGTPRVGDQIFFRYSGTTGADHTGLVTEVSASGIVTVEGNSNNEVRRKSYDKSYYAILGYGHPLYDEEKKEEKTVNIEMPVLKYGDKGEEVKTLQRLLKQLEWCDNSGTLIKVDGTFGQKTDETVRRYQQKKLGSADGIVGAKTWTRLLKGV